METLEKTLEDCRKVLSDAEIIKVLKAAKVAREAQNREKEYWEKVSKPTQWPKYSAEELMGVFMDTFKNRTGKNFELDQYSGPVLEAICLYFTTDERFLELDEAYSFEKGILLFGNVGCGKSEIMKILEWNQKASYQCCSCADIAREHSTKGYNQFDKYTNPAPNHSTSQRFFGHELLGWCFDDIGFETEARHFGKATNIMAEILHKSYENPKMRGRIHGTTNLSSEELLRYYGTRITSRMRESFNVIAYHKDAPDRRK